MTDSEQTAFRYLAFHDLTWREAQERLARRAVVILPVGSTEAHGPHLPLATDVIISEEMSRRAALKLAARNIEALVLPPLSYSVTDFSSDFSGSISIRKETAAALIRDVCVSLYGQGAGMVVIANSHLEPEHVASINDAIEQVRQETGRRVVFPDKRRRRWASTLTEEFRRGDCHAGSYETSLVLAARPELVREEIRLALERVPISISEKIGEGARTFTEAGGIDAYFGDPRAASREEGDRSYEALSDMLVAAVLESLAQAETGSGSQIEG
ncbi:MAG TPA: creatininase family protein [Blastocatellia bacterium]|jgi:creatinine amidohydrolase|nr:creatininase family protein [Blastocatellia bacterium]